MLQACGYNPCFLDSRLEIPKSVRLVELGLTAYQYLEKNRNETAFSNYKHNFSIHISRSPITESLKFRKFYFEEKLPKKLNLENTLSIGFHLCGNRSENIGKYGFSSHYDRCEISEKTYVNIENSDVIWARKSNDFYFDFELLNRIGFNKKEYRSIDEKRKKYALSYLKKTLEKSVSNYAEIAHAFELTKDNLFMEWVSYFEKNNKALVLTELEVDPNHESVYFLKSFNDFVEKCQS